MRSNRTLYIALQYMTEAYADSEASQKPWSSCHGSILAPSTNSYLSLILQEHFSFVTTDTDFQNAWFYPTLVISLPEYPLLHSCL